MSPALSEVNASFRTYEGLHSAAGKTVAVSLDIEGRSYTVIVPEGTSSGEREAVNVPVSQAIKNINEIIVPMLQKKNIDFTDLKEVDEFLIDIDGTPNKRRLGANAILAISEVCSKAAADYLDIPLFDYLAREYYVRQIPRFEMPVPHANVLNGGRHGEGGLPIQEVMVVPTGARSYHEAVNMLIEIYGALGKKIGPASGTEAGYIPTTFNAKNGADKVKEALDMMTVIVRDVGLVLGDNIFFALDVAASELVHDDGLYYIDEITGWNADRVIAYLADLAGSYPIISIEDGLGQNESLGKWAQLTACLKQTNTQSVGDDLLVTNVQEIRKAIEANAVNSVLIKPNQIGTLSETMDAMKLARRAGYTTMLSHRSRMADNIEADLAVGTSARQVKFGPPAKERISFHNRLLEIESFLGGKAIYTGNLQYSSTRM